MKINFFKKTAALVLALLILVSAAPVSSAYYQCDQTVITSIADGHVDKILADLERQSFESEAQRARVKEAVLYLLTDSTFTAVGQGRFPYLNANGYADRVSDGVYDYAVYAAGCYAYAKWASQVVYGEGKTGQQLYVKDAQGNPVTSTWALSPEGLKDFVRSKCQAGEHMRIDYVHSLCFLACSDEGIYFADYAGDGKALIRLCYASYEAFYNAVRTGSSFWLSDVVSLENGGGSNEGEGGVRISLTVNEPYISVNGVKSPIDSEGTTPVIKNGRTLLPIACVIRAMGGSVQWTGSTKTVDMSLAGKTLSVRIGLGSMWDSTGNYPLDPAPEIIGGRTMVPLRAVVEYFGAEVLWDNAAKTATIIYPGR